MTRLRISSLGSERLCEQVRITPKGLTKLAQQFCVGGVQ